MIAAERIQRSLLSGVQFSGSSSAISDRPQKSLITDGPWDRYHLESLLALKETYRENREFGFLLRHYWIPATELRYRQSSRLKLPDGTVDRQELVIERRMARCYSNECLWREKTFPAAAIGGNNGNNSQAVSALSELLCSYDCYEQTFHCAKPILFAPLTPVHKTEACREALYRLPMLVPPGPVPLGFCWYGKVGDDYMNYRLEAEEHIGETSVLVVRREGRYTIWVSREWARSAGGGSAEPPIEAPGDGANATRVVTERKGITLFAWNRGTVLEDRFEDRVVEADGCLASAAGAMSQVVTRLIRSCPEKLAEPAMRKLANQEPPFCAECKP